MACLPGSLQYTLLISPCLCISTKKRASEARFDTILLGVQELAVLVVPLERGLAAALAVRP